MHLKFDKQIINLNLFSMLKSKLMKYFDKFINNIYLKINSIAFILKILSNINAFKIKKILINLMLKNI